MPVRDETLGRVDISAAAIATITNQAVNQCYGVVAMANKNLVNGIAQALTRDSRRGIEISTKEDEIVIDVFVVVEYGVRIRVVAESIQHTVKFHVEKALGMPVTAVNVYIQGLRQSHDNG